MRFPFIQPRIGAPVPSASLLHRNSHRPNVPSAMTTCLPDHWVEVTRGTRAPELYEQIYVQRDGYALILLQLEQDAAEDEEHEDQQLERSWEARFRR